MSTTEYDREVLRMRPAETVLNVIRERGERGLPLENIYRLLPRDMGRWQIQPGTLPAGLRSSLLNPGRDDQGNHRRDRGRNVTGENRPHHRRTSLRAVPMDAGQTGQPSPNQMGEPVLWAYRHGRTSCCKRLFG